MSRTDRSFDWYCHIALLKLIGLISREYDTRIIQTVEAVQCHLMQH
jgi:hypothetical protein